MKIALILNYKNFKQTIECINKTMLIEMQQIVIVDNFSQNDSYKILCDYFCNYDTVTVIQTKDNLGFAEGNNYGLKVIEEKFGIDSKNVVFIINPDTLITEKAIDEITEFILTAHNSGAVSSLVNDSSESAWHHISKLRAYLLNIYFINWIMFKFNVKEHVEYSNLNKGFNRVDVVTGAFFGISQAKFKEINYFDDNTFLYYEEEILYAKLIKLGYQNYILCDASVSHLGHGSTSISKIYFKKINDKSRLYLLSKYYNVSFIYETTYKVINIIDNFILKLVYKISRR